MNPDDSYDEMRDKTDYQQFVDEFAETVIDILDEEYADVQVTTDDRYAVAYEVLDAAEEITYNRYAPLWGDILLFSEADDRVEWESYCTASYPLEALRGIARALLRADLDRTVDEKWNDRDTDSSA